MKQTLYPFVSTVSRLSRLLVALLGKERHKCQSFFLENFQNRPILPEVSSEIITNPDFRKKKVTFNSHLSRGTGSFFRLLEL